VRNSKLKIGFVATLFGALATVAIGLTPAVAHTNLITQTPEANSQIASWPAQITLEFDEQLQNLGDEKANFLVVNNAAGDQVSENDETLLGNTITVTLSPNQVQGPVLVYYRVVSGDGHPVEGEYTFTYGIGVEIAEGVVEEETTEYPIAVYLASAAFIVSGLFFAIYSYRRRSRI
jgi:methionine-rich copper-binding protein CopC